MVETTRKIKEIKEFNEEIEADVVELKKRSVEIKEKFASKLFEERNSKGCLTHSLDRYNHCLGEVDFPQLHSLMLKDLNYWEAYLKETERNKNT